MGVLAPYAGIRQANWGTKVVKTESTHASGDVSLFTIATGRVIVTGIVGRVSVAIGATASNMKLSYDPTAAGTTFDLCAAVSVASKAVEQTLYIAGDVATVGNLLVGGAVGQCNPWFAKPLTLQPGAILQNLSADPTAGTVIWDLWYIPYDDGATVVAA